MEFDEQKRLKFDEKNDEDDNDDDENGDDLTHHNFSMTHSMIRMRLIMLMINLSCYPFYWLSSHRGILLASSAPKETISTIQGRRN